MYQDVQMSETSLGNWNANDGKLKTINFETLYKYNIMFLFVSS